MKKISTKKIIATSIISLFFVQIFYIVFAEPSVTLAATAPDAVIVTLNVTSGLTLSNGTDVLMAPNISMSANKSIGSSSWVATTNSATGYTLAVKASTTPALKNGAVDSFADYTEGTAGTPDLWGGIAVGAKEFGYSAYGTNVPTATWGTAPDCGSAGIPNILGKYRGFTTSDITIASLGTVTPTAGITTNICFAAEQNAVYAASGAYSATITATMTAA